MARVLMSWSLTGVLLLGCVACGDRLANGAPGDSPPQEEEPVGASGHGEDPKHSPHSSVRRPPPTPEEIASLPPDGGPDYNRLVFEKSPYLLQHAANPVNWYPWGKGAFEAAKKQNKPIFLSIGYSTCHWCHVMERESFEDEGVAALLNQAFISIKVDREEREDVDNIYMAVCMALNGSGGWPLSVFLTPERKPFYAGTYFPKDDRPNRPGFENILTGITKAWDTNRKGLIENAERIVAHLEKTPDSESSVTLDRTVLDRAFASFRESFDEVYGGFGNAPKFPAPHDYTFLLRYWLRSGNREALDMVTRSLTSMRRGGVYDHVGFGFHRYSTDRLWLLPHFEKMLYDQATLTMAFTEAYLATGDEFFSTVAKEICEYVLRDMHGPEGAFYSAEDADSEGVEGKFYYWTEDQLIEVLGQEDGQSFAEIFGFEDRGNFREQSTGEHLGTNIVHLKRSLEEEAKSGGQETHVLKERWAAARRKLFETRERRIHPLKDDKILTSWNGLMIAALAKAGRAFNEPTLTEAAAQAADFLLSRMRNADGRLLRRYRQNQAAHLAYLDDYAFLTWGLIELYQATFDLAYLNSATKLTEETLRLFSDEGSGGLFFSGKDGEKLILRKKEAYDGAAPSGNSVMCSNLFRLSRLLARTDWEERAEALLQAFANEISRVPTGYSQFLVALDFSLGPTREIVISGRRDSDDTRAMLSGLAGIFDPRQVVLFRPDGEAAALAMLPEFVRNQGMVQGKATAYLCENFSCRQPVTDVLQLLTLIERSLAPQPTGSNPDKTKEATHASDKK